VNTKTRLWNRNFFLLWQGQLVSAIGDVFYQVALGFWILAQTGSTGLMGTLMTTSTLPRIVLSPFLGVLVDRMNRKWLLVITDGIRGSVVTVVAVGAFAGWLEIWMVFGAGIIIGICAAFFDPAVHSTIPDLVEPELLIKGNSVFSMIQTLSGILGNSIGGLVYTFLGAPIMFLINGISYLFSSGTELFLKIPLIQHQNQTFNFFSDMKLGLNQIRSNKILMLLFINIGILNFFLTMGGVLYLPYFHRSEVFVPAQFGILMAILTGGSFLGHGLLGIVKVPRQYQFRVFAISALVFSVTRGGIFLVPALASIYTLAGISGFAVAIINTIIMTTMQKTIPREHRGKILGLTSALGGGLIPLGMALGGLLAEVIAIPLIVAFSGFVCLLGFFPLILNRDFKQFLVRADDESPPKHPTENQTTAP
jgi:DHA3 family macrolide efflux protein-like MFS transporter